MKNTSRSLIVLFLFSLLLPLTGRAQSPTTNPTADQAAALAVAGEVGANDFRISTMGSDDVYDTWSAAVAFNSANNQFLVVWSGDDLPGAPDEIEIWGQRYAANGAPVGDLIRVSDMGPDNDTAYAAYVPDVVYNPAENEYLVVWSGRNTAGEGNEIYAQLIDGATGASVGFNDLQISSMGPAGVNYAGHRPAVTYNSVENEYFIVWWGDDDANGLLNDEFEIHGQIVDSNLLTIVDEFQISAMGGANGSAASLGQNPDVAHNGANNQYVVVWYGDHLVNDAFEIWARRLDGAGGSLSGQYAITDAGGKAYSGIDAAGDPAIVYNSVANEFLVVYEATDTILLSPENEIFGQRLNATGGEIGANDFPISDMGPAGSATYNVADPAVVYDGNANAYMVVWYADDNSGALTNDEFEIFGQRLSSAGTPLDANDFRISDAGTDGDVLYSAGLPAIAFDATLNQFLVVWQADDPDGGAADEEYELFGQLLSADGTAVGVNDFRMTYAGGDEKYEPGAYPDVAYNSQENEYLVVWDGDDNSGGHVEDEDEIWGQLINAADGSFIGDRRQISDAGGVGVTSFSAENPAVAYNSVNNEYLVVWYGEDNEPPLVDGNVMIFGQRLDANGNPKGAPIWVTSVHAGNTQYVSYDPAVAYNSTNNEYLVVWHGDRIGLVANEDEIFGQRIASDGSLTGALQFRISDMGPGGDTTYRARNADVAYSSASNQYLVVWEGEEVDEEFEIFGQRLNAVGSEIGSNDLGVFKMGRGMRSDGSTADLALHKRPVRSRARSNQI